VDHQCAGSRGDCYDQRHVGSFTIRDGVITAVREYFDTDHAHRIPSRLDRSGRRPPARRKRTL